MCSAETLQNMMLCCSLRIRLYVVRIQDYPYIPLTWGWDGLTMDPIPGRGLDS